jgi:hypothetical protein
LKVDTETNDLTQRVSTYPLVLQTILNLLLSGTLIDLTALRAGDSVDRKQAIVSRMLLLTWSRGQESDGQSPESPLDALPHYMGLGALTKDEEEESEQEENAMVRIQSKQSLAASFAAVILLLLSSMPLECKTKEPTRTITVPEWTSMRIRLDTTLTSKYSRIGDPLTATVVDRGPYQGARVYGRVSSIEQSGRIKGRTSMVLRFTRLRMPDGRQARINAEIVRLYHAPSGESVDVEGAIESGGRGKKSAEHTAIGAGAGALFGAIFGGGKGAGIGSIIGGAGGLGTTAFRGRQDVTLERGLEMLIRVTRPR